MDINDLKIDYGTRLLIEDFINTVSERAEINRPLKTKSLSYQYVSWIWANMHYLDGEEGK